MKRLKLNIQLFAATNTISCSQTSRDIENNKSVQKITTKFTRTSGTTFWQDAKTITFKCTYQNDDGTTTTLTKNTTFSFPSGAVGMTKSISVEFEVSHKADGSQTISYSSSIVTGTSMGTMTANGSSVLSTIPRASKVSCTSGNIEDTLAIIVEKYSDSFTSTITYQIGTLTGTIATKSSAQSFALNTSSIADSIYEQIPNDASIKGTITCTTFNDDVQISEPTTTEFTLSVNKDKNLADVSVSFVDTNASIKNLTGSDKKFIKYFSKPKVTVTATAKNYATITDYKISMSAGSTYDTSEATFNEMLSNIITVTVTDSRGFQKVILCTLDMIEYTKLVCLNAEVNRTEDTSLEGILNAEINYFKGSFGSVDNQLSLKAQYRKNTDTSWTDIESIDYISDNGKITLSDYSLGKLFDYSYEYIVRIVVEDSLMILNTDISFQKGSAVLEVLDDLVNINGDFTINDINIVDLIYPIGSIYFSTNEINPSIIFGGVWERIKDTFLLASGDTYANGSTGGEATHLLTIEEMPTHQHSLANYNESGTESSYTNYTVERKDNKGYNNNILTSFSGGNKEHNNMPPYLVINVWKRTE